MPAHVLNARQSTALERINCTRSKGADIPKPHSETISRPVLCPRCRFEFHLFSSPFWVWGQHLPLIRADISGPPYLIQTGRLLYHIDNDILVTFTNGIHESQCSVVVV